MVSPSFPDRIAVGKAVEVLSKLTTMVLGVSTKSVSEYLCRAWTLANEYNRYIVYSMAQASKAILPKDPGGPWGQRIGVSVSGSMAWGLIVGAYVTGRVNPTDWLRYSLVVLNW